MAELRADGVTAQLTLGDLDAAGAVTTTPATSVPAGATVTGPRPWRELELEVLACTKCSLSDGRSSVVFGDGDLKSKLVFVGEAPGRHEDLQGKPFVGAAGNLLSNLLAEHGVARSDVYIANVIKCRPPGNRDPRPDEIEACSPFLREQLDLIAPRVIVTLGNFATRLLLRKDVPISRVAGYRFDVLGATLIPTFHPAAALRGSPQAMAALRRDVRTAIGVAEGKVASAREALAEMRAKQATSLR